MRIGEYVKIEMFASIAEAILFATLFAWFEVHAQTGSPVLLGHFAVWNVIMLLAAILIFSVPFIGAWIRGEHARVIAIVVADIILWVTLEDIFWDFWEGVWPNSSYWINWFFGGFTLPYFPIWVPLLYIIGPIAAAALYFVGFNYTD